MSREKHVTRAQMPRSSTADVFHDGLAGPHLVAILFTNSRDELPVTHSIRRASVVNNQQIYPDIALDEVDVFYSRTLMICNVVPVRRHFQRSFYQVYKGGASQSLISCHSWTSTSVRCGWAVELITSQIATAEGYLLSYIAVTAACCLLRTSSHPPRVNWRIHCQAIQGSWWHHT